MTDFNENLFYTLNQNRNHRVSIRTMKFPGGEVGVNINTGSIAPFTTQARWVGKQADTCIQVSNIPEVGWSKRKSWQWIS